MKSKGIRYVMKQCRHCGAYRHSSEIEVHEIHDCPNRFDFMKEVIDLEKANQSQTTIMQTEAPGRPQQVSQPGREGNKEPKSVGEDEHRVL